MATFIIGVVVGAFVTLTGVLIASGWFSGKDIEQ